MSSDPQWAREHPILAGLSVGEILEESARRYPEKPAFLHSDRQLTYRDLEDGSRRLAAALASRARILAGECVVVYLPNSLELVLAFYALQKLGAVVTWASPLFRREELLFELRNTAARVIILSHRPSAFDSLGLVRELSSEAPILETIVSVGGGEGTLNFEELADSDSSDGFVLPMIDVRESPAMICYTSGSTGIPKGAPMTHYSIAGQSLAYNRALQVTNDDVLLGALPLSHAYGGVAILVAGVLAGATTVLMDQFRAPLALQLIERHGITIQHGAPTHLLLELDDPSFASAGLKSLRAGLTSGFIPPEGLMKRAEEKLGIYLSCFWGSSETGGGILTPYGTSAPLRYDVVGLPHEGSEVRCVDPATGHGVSCDEVGELCYRGWNLMKGYWRNPDENAKAFDRDGWFHTGDLISIGEDGFVRMHGRTKDQINRGAYKIIPSEVERLISQMPQVAQVSIVSTPNPVLGESVCACVVLVQGASLSLEEIRDHLSGKVAAFKLPDELCLFDDFPRLVGGVKINKYGKGGLQESAAQMPRERWHSKTRM